MLLQRVATAAVGLPIVFLLILAGGPLYVGAAALILLIGTLEFQSARLGWRSPLALLGAALSAALAAGAFVGADWVLWFTLGGVLLPLAWVTVRGDAATALDDWLWTVGAVLYIGLLGSHLVLTRELDNGRDWVYLAVIATFANDTASYFVGRAIGRRALAPHISPGKTVEGALGGFAGAIAAAVLLNYFLGLRLEAALIVPLAVLIPLASQVGDLAESILKRGMQVKDASQLLPGHGGFMDRLDSILLTSVVVYYFVVWVLP
jgi:phosphatidate cytidylyltransferase